MYLLNLPSSTKYPLLHYTDPPAEDDIDLILERGRSEGDPFHAVALFKKVLQAKPEDTVIMGEAAELLLQVGETAEAKEVLYSIGASHPYLCPNLYRG